MAPAEIGAEARVCAEQAALALALDIPKTHQPQQQQKSATVAALPPATPSQRNLNTVAGPPTLQPKYTGPPAAAQPKSAVAVLPQRLATVVPAPILVPLSSGLAATTTTTATMTTTTTTHTFNNPPPATPATSTLPTPPKLIIEVPPP